MNTSVIAQLENDQFDESIGDELEQSYRRGHNFAVRQALVYLRRAWELNLQFLPEKKPNSTETERAFARGFNGGVRHIKDVLAKHAEKALRELADAPAIATVDIGQEKP